MSSADGLKYKRTKSITSDDSMQARQDVHCQGNRSLPTMGLLLSRFYKFDNERIREVQNLFRG